MNLRGIGSLVAVGALSLSMTGCMQFGEYAMGGECDDLSDKVTAIVEDELHAEPAVENIWSGQADIWCRFNVVTGVDLAVDDPARVRVMEQVRSLIEETLGEDVQVVLVYSDDEDDITT